MPIDVHLEVFEGPLDLLLFLIKKDDLDINNIPISRITSEYLSYLDVMKELDLDIAGEFLVTATTLMAIKARTLLPSQPEGPEEGPDPRQELVAKLLEYQKFKQAAQFLDTRASEFRDVFYRGEPSFDDADKTLAIGVFDLVGALREILDRTGIESREVAGEEFPVETRIEKILFLLSQKPALGWEEIFADERKRRGVLSCFFALLELVRMQKVFIRQEANFGRIMIFKRETQVAEPIVTAAEDNPQNGNG
jgi:segregation and condensation protein A